MPNLVIYKARALKPQTRAAVEAELGRSLRDDEDVSIIAFGAHDSPASEACSRTSQKLETYFRRTDKKTASGSDKVSEAALQRAPNIVRPKSES
jgi:hypothetical protein